MALLCIVMHCYAYLYALVADELFGRLFFFAAVASYQCFFATGSGRALRSEPLQRTHIEAEHGIVRK